MKTISALVAALVLAGSLALTAPRAMADDEETVETYNPSTDAGQ